MPEQDSTMMETERKILYQQMLSGILANGEMIENIELPAFNFNTEFAKRYKFDSSEIPANQYSFNQFSPGIWLFSPSPFFQNGAIFSSAEYQLSNKFTLGGYSFGASSVFLAPLPHQGINNFDTRGATMFMQYKVSKNFKIETRVSVSQGPGNGF